MGSSFGPDRSLLRKPYGRWNRPNVIGTDNPVDDETGLGRTFDPCVAVPLVPPATDFQNLRYGPNGPPTDLLYSC